MNRPTRTHWLSMHVPYACRHSGVCCSSGWDIPIEHPRVAAAAALRPGVPWLLPVAGAPHDVAGVIARSTSGRCVFHGDGCDLQHARGHAAIPSACQHFPRQVLIDARGVFVTLSHYCPTAADLLFTHAGAVEIVEGPPVLPHGDPEGLDARDVLPPLLVNGVLMDWDGYSAWEAHLVAVLSSGRVPEESLARLGEDLRAVQRWRPGAASLRAAIVQRGRTLQRAQVARRAPSSGALSENAVIGRYLASCAFASWEAFGETGVAAVLTRLEAALRMLRTQKQRRGLREAIRDTDLEMVHLRRTPAPGP